MEAMIKYWENQPKSMLGTDFHFKINCAWSMLDPSLLHWKHFSSILDIPVSLLPIFLAQKHSAMFCPSLFSKSNGPTFLQALVRMLMLRHNLSVLVPTISSKVANCSYSGGLEVTQALCLTVFELMTYPTLQLPKGHQPKSITGELIWCRFFSSSKSSTFKKPFSYHLV